MAKAKRKRQTIKEFVDGLYCDEVSTEVRTVDWQDLAGQDCEGWHSHEVSQCGDCGKPVYNQGQLGETRHNDLDSETECRGYLNFDGPMMNYFYPCDLRRAGGLEAAARSIRDTSCVVIEMEDGETGFALAGGGMDLTWDIAGAYVACGQLPPVDKTRLPRFAGKRLTANARRIIAACIHSNEVATNFARANIEDLKRVRAALGDETKRRREAKRHGSSSTDQPGR
jgi:hypothetical protein